MSFLSVADLNMVFFVQSVTIASMRNGWRLVVKSEVFTPDIRSCAFRANLRLFKIVPDDFLPHRLNLTRFYGVFAPNATVRAEHHQ
jgi:hypothetical protein